MFTSSLLLLPYSCGRVIYHHDLFRNYWPKLPACTVEAQGHEVSGTLSVSLSRGSAHPTSAPPNGCSITRHEHTSPFLLHLMDCESGGDPKSWFIASILQSWLLRHFKPLYAGAQVVFLATCSYPDHYGRGARWHLRYSRNRAS